MNKAPEKKSLAPVVIIGLVLLAGGAAAWYFLTQPSKPAGNSNTARTNTNAPRAKSIPSSAPAGATPPNLAGSPTATVTVEEFADYQCPQCANVNPIMNEIKSAYGSRIKFIFRNYPLSIPEHDKAYDAAAAAEAAGMQGQEKFWAMQNLLLSNQKSWTANPNYRELWKSYASSISGLDVERWETDRVGLAAKGRVSADLERGKGAGVNSTPSIFVNGMEVPFPQVTVPGLKTIIDAELAKAAPQNQPASNAPASNGTTNK